MQSTSFLLGAVLSAFVTIAVQDPVKPEATAPKAGESAATSTKDAPGRPARHAFEGVYALQKRVVDGKELMDSRGYLAITSRHMFLCVAAAGSDPALPLLRASVHEWRPTRELVHRVVKLSYYTDASGGIHADQVGATEVRSIQPQQGGLKVVQDGRSWLEFTRLE